MIVDCFNFFDELDLLEMRLRLLEDVVDRFVLCEAAYTYRGSPKPRLFAANRARFARWLDRIVEIPYDGVPDPEPWRFEIRQRNRLADALVDLAPDDLILLSDLDEFPAPENVARRPEPGRILGHLQDFCHGYFNRVRPAAWVGTRSFRRADLDGRTLHELREVMLYAGDLVRGGWHVSGLGGADRDLIKMRANSHAEIDIPYYRDLQRLRTGYDAATGGVVWRPFDDAYPAVFHDPRYAAFVWEQPTAEPDEAVLHAHGCFTYVPDGARLAVLAVDRLPVWDRVGRARFGERFAGVVLDVATACYALGAGDVVVIDDAPWFAAGDLRRLAAAGIVAVAYAPNARSFDVLLTAATGGGFPPGPVTDRERFVAHVDAGGYAIERIDDIQRPISYQVMLAREKPQEMKIGPLRFPALEADQIRRLATVGYVALLRPAAATN